MSDSARPSALDPAENPLFGPTHLVPRFEAVRPEHVVPGVTALLEELQDALTALEGRLDQPTWETVLDPLERIQDRFRFAWSLVAHLMAVRNEPALRAAHDEVQPKMVEFGLRISQSEPLYDAVVALHRSPEFHQLSRAQQRIIENYQRSARHSGIGLKGEKKERFNQLLKELAELKTRFSNNVLDATKAYHLDLTSEDEVAGLPASSRRLAAQTYGQGATAENGPWRITLDGPSLGPFLEHCPHRDLRKEILRASNHRGSEGDTDNREIISKILRMRREMAEILGFSTYAELSVDAKMAENVAAVDQLTADLRERALERSHRDLEELRELARAEGASEAEDLRQWDLAFWANRLREKKFDYTDEQLRPYFPLDRVLAGLFDMAQRLFDVKVVPGPNDVPKWHPDVQYFEVQDLDGTARAAFYLDPFSRPAEKRGGAWMGECLARSNLFRHEGQPLRLPVAYLVCNQTPPVGDTPSLMSFSEVLTLFHEFGHGLQHMLTDVDYGFASGIR
ncbi:MAG: M3 family metallopeptidase, partial [Planctomycetes bacterium]|nr:M3 family metallopeptidase [Planctomycetota bacterium]